MIKPADLYKILLDKDIRFFAGVPDSLLKDFCGYVNDNAGIDQYLLTANEGNAIAFAAGYNLATNKIPLVYMQNSGLGNSINPLLSLVDPDVYAIPVLLLIGWRGQPGTKDEPQHLQQGLLTLSLLDTMKIPYMILPKTNEEVEKAIQIALTSINNTSGPFALIVENGTFEKYEYICESKQFELSREEAIKIILDQLDENAIVVSTTGKASREVYECRINSGKNSGQDFLTVGSMGHASLIALGIAERKRDRNIYCLDGDGAAIMHLGSFTTIGTRAKNNYKHILLNNGAHESVGGQPTAGFNINFCKIASACGYQFSEMVSRQIDLLEKLEQIKKSKWTSIS